MFDYETGQRTKKLTNFHVRPGIRSSHFPSSLQGSQSEKYYTTRKCYLNVFHVKLMNNFYVLLSFLKNMLLIFRPFLFLSRRRCYFNLGLRGHTFTLQVNESINQ